MFKFHINKPNNCALISIDITDGKCIYYMDKNLAIELMPNLPEYFKNIIRNKK